MEKMTCRQGMADTPQAWIYYKESGRGTPILMLHGNAETHLIFDYYEKKLSMKYRVILMDSRAHGRSRIKPEYAESEFTTTDMARDAAALLDILHIPSCILFGFSDGANIALEFASLFPDRTRAVIAISGNVSPDGLILPVRAFCVGKYFCLKAATSLFREICKKNPAAMHPFRKSFSVINSSLPCSAILPRCPGQRKCPGAGSPDRRNERSGECLPLPPYGPADSPGAVGLISVRGDPYVHVWA